MNNRSAFHLDCTAVIPQCGYECSKCIQELESTVTAIPGVSSFYLEGDGVVVEHDPDAVTARQLIDVFKTLPSFYDGFFIPTVTTLSQEV